MGYRAAVGEGIRGDVAVGTGIDVSGVLTTGVENADIDVLWWSGIGAGVGDDLMISVPLGIVAGWTGSGVCACPTDGRWCRQVRTGPIVCPGSPRTGLFL